MIYDFIALRYLVCHKRNSNLQSTQTTIFILTRSLIVKNRNFFIRPAVAYVKKYLHVNKIGKLSYLCM